MLEHFLGEGQTKIGLFVLWIAGNARFSIGNGKTVVLELYVSKWSIGIVNGKLALGNSRTLRQSEFDCFRVAVHCLLELIIFELIVALLFALLTLDKVVDH